MTWLTRGSIRHPALLILALGVVTAVLAMGLPRLRTEFGFRVLLGEEHPTIRTLDEFISRFGGGFPVYILWECGEGLPCRSVFDPSSLLMAQEICATLAASADIRRAEGLSNAPILVPASDGFSVRRLVERGAVAADVDSLAERVLADALWRDRLVSSDGSVGVMVVQSLDSRNETQERMVDLVLGVVEPYQRQGFRFHMLGSAFESVLPGRELAQSTARLVPVTIIVIAMLLWLLCGSWQFVLLTLAAIGLALAWTFGLLGWLDWPQDGILEVLAPLLLVVGVCDAIHFLASYARQVGAGCAAAGPLRMGALEAAADEVGLPCLITTATTALAFASFSLSPLDSFVRFGTIAAFGVGACLIATFSVIPLLAMALPAARFRSRQAESDLLHRLLCRVATLNRRAGPAIVMIGALLAVVSAVGCWGRLQADTDWLATWGEDSSVTRAVRFAEARLHRSSNLELQVVLPEDLSLESTGAMREVEQLTAFLGATPGLGTPFSVLDLISRLNRLVHDDDPRFERGAASAAGNAELLELLAFDDPEVLEAWVSLDRSRLRISVNAESLPHSDNVEILDRVKHYLRTALPTGWRVLESGAFAADVEWVRDVQATQLRSFPVAFALVLALVAVFLRSLRLALLAMVPTLLPVLIVLGAMGWGGMHIDVARAMFASVMIGIAVDDSVHLLCHYRVRRSLGDPPGAAIESAVLHIGHAIITTSLALALGFATFTASAWQSVASFGLLMSGGILLALAATLIVLPALIFVFAQERE